MSKRMNLFAILGLAGCLLLPGLAESKPSQPQACQLDSQEFVYFQLELSQNLNNLQMDLVSSNIRDGEVVNAMNALVRANANLYNDTGRYASQHDKFVYSKEKLQLLKDAAYEYYSIVYYKYRNLSSHVLNAYKMAQAADYAIQQFDDQCSRSSRRSKTWMNGWDNIYNSQAGAMVAPPARPMANPNPNVPAVNDANVVYRPAVNPQGAQVAQPNQPNHMVARPGSPAQPHPPVVMPMNNVDFQNFYNSVQRANFDDDKLVVIRSVVNSGNRLTCDQIVRILKLMDFDAKRVDAAVEMHKSVYDSNNWFKVYDAFEFSSYRNELDRRLK